SQTQVALYDKGNYHVYAISGGLATEVSSVTLVQDTAASIALNLAQAAAVNGRAVMPGEEVTTRPRVFNLMIKTGDEPTSSSIIAQASTSISGHFNFPTLPFGDFIIEASN